MNLDQLEAFNAVVEKGSFRSAAEELHRSQPALSSTIKNLEEEFGLLLFDRSQYRPKLTEAGQAFLLVARETLQSAHYAKRVAQELGNRKVETRLRVTVDPLISIELIEHLAHECARPTLPVNLILDKSILQGSYQDLIAGKIDLALAVCPAETHLIEKIFLEEVVLVGAVSRKLLQEKRKATEGFLSSHPQILTYDRRDQAEPDEIQVNGVLPRAGHKIYVPDHFTKLRLISGGIGWGRISKTEFEESHGLVAIDKNLCAPITLQLCLIRARKTPLGPVAQAIWKAFQVKARNEQKTQSLPKK